MAVEHGGDDPRANEAEGQLQDAEGQTTDLRRFRQRLSRWGPYKRWVWYRALTRDDYEWDRDGWDNDRSKLPEDEHIDVAMVSVIELYTPSTVGGLLEGIERLGWEYRRSGEDRLSEWMSDVRNGRTAGWTSLGAVTRPSEKRPFTDRVADLPAHCQAALPQLWSVTPGLTALTISFILTDESARALDDPMHGDFTTARHASSRYRRWHLIPHLLWGREVHYGKSIEPPSNRRRRRVAEELCRLEQESVRWTRRHLPGAFATTLSHVGQPTCLLLLTDFIDPLTEDSRNAAALSGSGLDQSYLAWEVGPEWPAARITFSHRGLRDPDHDPFRMTVACRRDDAIPERRRQHVGDPTSNWSISYFAGEILGGLGVRWALGCLLDGYGQLLARHRDETAGEASFRPVHDLKELRRIVRTETYDILTAVDEIESIAGDRPKFAYGVVEPTRMRNRKPTMGEGESEPNDRVDLVDLMREAQLSGASRVRQDVERLMAALAASADLTQAISNIRTQRVVLAMTIMSIAVACIAVYVAVKSQGG